MTQLSLAVRVNLNSVKEWCTCGYCSVMPTNRACLCCRQIDGIIFGKLSDGILIHGIMIFTLLFKSNIKFVSNRISSSRSKDVNFIAIFSVNRASSNY